MRLRIQLRNIIRVCRFRTLDIFSSEVGELRDLVCEHFVDRGWGEDAALGERGDAAVDEHHDYMDVVFRAAKTTGAGAVIDEGGFVGRDNERAAVWGVAGSCLWTFGWRGRVVHVR